MWKRIAVLVVFGLTAALATVAPAHADKPVCYEVPELPGECLSEAAFALVTKSQADRDYWQKQSEQWQRSYFDATRAIHAFADTVTVLRYRLALKNERILTLRVRIKYLRTLI